MKKIIVTGLLICTMSLMMAGCKKEEETPPTGESEVVVLETETEPEETEARPSGINLLTGEPMEEELAAKRPVAIMIGNTSDSLPQCGVGQADIIYEVPVEGGITRLMAFFQDYTNLDSIGSVRSCRHYFVYYAKEFDAMYMHYGQSYISENLLGSGFIDDINGLDSKIDSLAFTRLSDRKAPHNAFTSSAGIQAAIEYEEYRTEYEEDYQGHYRFAAEDAPITLSTGEDAAVVCPGYVTNKPWFVYHEDDGLYYRFQYSKEHVDGNTNEQLTFKNIIFQYSASKVLDDKGRLDITTNGTGSGKYITNGKAIDITWERADDNSITRYYDENGEELTLNQGKTCVCIVSNDSVKRIAFYASEADFEAAQ